jgi:hypothetical protein
MSYENKYLKYLGKNNLIGGYRCVICYSNSSNIGIHDNMTRCESCGVIVCSPCIKKYVRNKCPREEKIVSWIIIPKTDENYKDQEYFFEPNVSEPIIRRRKPIGYIEQTILEPVSVAPIGFIEQTVLEPIPVAVPVAMPFVEMVEPVFVDNFAYGIPMNIIID